MLQRKIDLMNIRTNKAMGLSREDNFTFDKELVDEVYGPLEAAPKPIQPPAPAAQPNKENVWDVLNYLEGVCHSRQNLVIETALKKAYRFNLNNGSPLSEDEIAKHVRYHWNARAKESEIAFKRQNKKGSSS